MLTLVSDVPAAVGSWADALEGCGYAVEDMVLGDAGLSAHKGQDAVLVTGTEEVLIVLHAQGRLSAARDELNSWADLALGTACTATSEGCT